MTQADLSRFGRNYLEVGRYLEVVYPTLGVKFIAIQENVNTLEGTGTEMMPFHNIFNEWYAAQTSKKIRAVWAMKAANGKRISPSVPYGYVRDPDNHEIWHIDGPAAEVVRKIFALCMAGKGPMQIANQLEDERIMCPTAYKLAMGRKGSHLPPADPTPMYGVRIPSQESCAIVSTPAARLISNPPPSAIRSTKRFINRRKNTRSSPIPRKRSLMRIPGFGYRNFGAISADVLPLVEPVFFLGWCSARTAVQNYTLPPRRA